MDTLGVGGPTGVQPGPAGVMSGITGGMSGITGRMSGTRDDERGAVGGMQGTMGDESGIAGGMPRIAGGIPGTVGGDLDATVYDRSGAMIGRVAQVYLDDVTGAPSWVTVASGERAFFVPLDGALVTDHQIRLGYEHGVIAGSPTVEPGAELLPEDEEKLGEYYHSRPVIALQPPDFGSPDDAA